MNASPTQPTLRVRQRKEREELILSEAERLLSEHGYQNLVMEQLAERVGIGKGTIYLHFPRKEDLVGAIVERGLEQLTSNIDEMAGRTEEPASERIEAVMHRIIDGHIGWTRMFEGSDARELLEGLRHGQSMNHRVSGLLQAMARLIDQGKAAGEFDETVDSMVAVVALFAVIRSLTSSNLVGHLPGERADIISASIRLVFRGLLVRPGDKEAAR
jgi:AcrR family transcriptional regulator